MRTFPLPGLRPPASPIALGTAVLGSSVGEDESLRILDRYAALGGTAIDTACCYAGWHPAGEGSSERVVGAWLRRSGARDRVQVWTKGGHPKFDDMGRSRLRPEDIAGDLALSLERLGVDHVDLYWLHRDDERVPVDELLAAAAPHVRSGKVRALGASNWSAARLEAAAHAARARGLPPFVASQCAWSLARRSPTVPPFTGCLDVDDAFLAWHRRTGFPLAAYTSQANGFFARFAAADFAADPKDPWRWPGNLPRLRRARELAERYAVPVNRIAVAYVIEQTFPSCAIVGPGSVAHLEDSMAALSLRLEAHEIAWLEGEEA